ncbi:unnamed protein product, partial [Ectocarpus sp. 12 AP-2014]
PTSGIPVSSNTQGARSPQPRIDRRPVGRYLQATAAQGEQPCPTRIVTSTRQVADTGNRRIHPTLPLLASNLLEPSLRLPLSRREELSSSRSRCCNLCAAPCGPKPVWNVTLPGRSIPPISLQPASTTHAAGIQPRLLQRRFGPTLHTPGTSRRAVSGPGVQRGRQEEPIFRALEGFGPCLLLDPSNAPGQHADTPRPAPRRFVVGQKARGAVVWGWFCWAGVRCVCWGFSATRR